MVGNMWKHVENMWHPVHTSAIIYISGKMGNMWKFCFLPCVICDKLAWVSTLSDHVWQCVAMRGFADD